MLLSVSGFPSSKTVQIRIYNVTTATEVVAWTSTGVSERADGQGNSTYYYDYAIVAGNEYIVDWKDNSTIINTASEGINAKQSGVSTHSAADVKTAVEADGSKLDAVYDKLPSGNIASPGDTMNLTGTYDAAKTAAQESTLTTLIARIGAFTGTGVNTVLGFFKAIMRKDATLPGDVGGTYDPASHSLEIPVQILSATKGAIQVSYAKNGGSVEVVKGDTISIPYGPLGKDITGRKVYFAAKQLLSDATYKIAIKEISAQITNAATFTGTIPLTSAELNLTAGNYYAEMESRAADGTSSPVTEMKFILKVVDQVIG